ncbi:Protein ALP1-like [Nymphon striatum]|nr:Protein ALP1-like [Nymphon striatum]
MPKMPCNDPKNIKIKLYCTCKMPDIIDYMIQCERKQCGKWFHKKCTANPTIVDKFQGFKLGGNVDQFGSTRTLLAKRILDALKKHYADLHDQAGIIAATEIANFHMWPKHENESGRQDFGNDKVQTLCLHFKNTLEKAEVDTAEDEMEWLLLKSHLYNRYKDGVQKLDWTEVHNAYLEGHRNILPVIDLIRTLPASGSENESGFSNMKQIMTDHRARIKTTTLDQLITIQMSTADIKNYDPEPAINQWIGGAKTSRRPTFMDGKEPKRAKLESLDDNASEVHEIIYDPENVCDNERDDFDSDFDDNEMNETIVPSWSDRVFKQNFRLSRSSFAKLVCELKPHIHHVNTKFRKSVPAEERLAITLWRLGTNIEYRSIDHLFGRAKSTCIKIVKEVTVAIAEHLLAKYISIPQGDNLLKVVSKFERRRGFPQIGGAIDGSQVKIIAPQDSHSDFYNRHHNHSVILQAVVDCDCKFLDVCLGWPGKAHDSRVFKNSKIYQAGITGKLFPDHMKKTISGVEEPIVLIGDPAYPLLPLLMKPFLASI